MTTPLADREKHIIVKTRSLTRPLFRNVADKKMDLTPPPLAPPRLKRGRPPPEHERAHEHRVSAKL